ncbi:MAG: metallopeptidase TldD-related protein [Bacteroidetes bacterium]|nr:metallopeptidase TldD-related protein [Bacteroidota bacterium]
MRLTKFIITLYILFLIPKLIYSETNSIILDAARKELTRTMEGLKEQQLPPYYLSYYIYDSNVLRIEAVNGKILKNSDDKSRTLDIDLRVGSYKFDNTHIVRGEAFNMGSQRNAYDLPLDDNETALRNAIWFATDQHYKKAIESYERVLTNTTIKVQEEDTSADFTKEKPYIYSEEPKKLNINKKLWEERLRKISEILSSEKWLFKNKMYNVIINVMKYFINSEGSSITQSEMRANVILTASTKADDGMALPLYKVYFAFSPDSLPDENTMLNGARQLVKTLSELKTASVMNTYTGPAILSGEAAGVFFHEIFGHRVEGHRLKDPDNSQTFKNFINTKILPDFLSVIFDPTINYLNHFPLSGYYKFDDEGVPAQKIECVENGVFKNFLMSRSPVENFPVSNGHGRKQAGMSAVSRQSNLIVETTKSVPVDTLKEMLKEECRKQGLEFGLFFKKVEGGFTFTSRSIPNSFNVNPLIVYKIYVDGKPDEIVRGVDLIGTPLTTFSNIIASANNLETFNGICGAESGSVPVSASSPNLLISRIEVQKKAKSQAKPPILDAP